MVALRNFSRCDTEVKIVAGTVYIPVHFRNEIYKKIAFTPYNRPYFCAARRKPVELHAQPIDYPLDLALPAYLLDLARVSSQSSSVLDRIEFESCATSLFNE